MPHCNKCGTPVADASAFCPSCGAPTGASAPPAGAQSGLTENVAGLLCYVLGWLTGLIFFLIDKRPYVRFHAAQSLVVFGGLHILRIVVGLVFGVSWWMGGWSFGAGFGIAMIGALFMSVVGLVMLVLWILLMIKAYQGERFKVPVAGDFAENLAGK